MLRQRTRPLEDDYDFAAPVTSPSAAALDVHPRVIMPKAAPGRRCIVHYVEASLLPALDDAAAFWSTVEHPSHVRVVEAGRLDHPEQGPRGYVVTEPPLTTVTQAGRDPVPLPRVLAIAADALDVLALGIGWRDHESGEARQLHHGALDGDELYYAHGRTQLVVGFPRHPSRFDKLLKRDNRDGVDDVRALQRICRRLLALDDENRAGHPVPLWGARLFKTEGLTVLELRARVRDALDGAATGLMRLDDVMHRVTRDDLLDHRKWIAQLLEQLPEYTRVARVTGAVWERIGAQLVDALRTNALDAPSTAILQRLPEAEGALLEVAGDADVDESARIIAARLLGLRRTTALAATTTLTALLNEPKPRLQEAAQLALAQLPRAPAVGADAARLRIVSCSHSWSALEPVDDDGCGRERRFCADCDRPVVRIDDVEALRGLVGQCAFFDGRPAKPRPTVPASGALTVYLGGGASYVGIGASMVVASVPGFEAFHPGIVPARVRITYLGDGAIVLSGIDGPFADGSLEKRLRLSATEPQLTLGSARVYVNETALVVVGATASRGAPDDDDDDGGMTVGLVADVE